MTEPNDIEVAARKRLAVSNASKGRVTKAANILARIPHEEAAKVTDDLVRVIPPTSLERVNAEMRAYRVAQPISITRVSAEDRAYRDAQRELALANIPYEARMQMPPPGYSTWADYIDAAEDRPATEIWGSIAFNNRDLRREETIQAAIADIHAGRGATLVDVPVRAGIEMQNMPLIDYWYPSEVVSVALARVDKEMAADPETKAWLDRVTALVRWANAVAAREAAQAEYESMIQEAKARGRAIEALPPREVFVPQEPVRPATTPDEDQAASHAMDAIDAWRAVAPILANRAVAIYNEADFAARMKVHEAEIAHWEHILIATELVAMFVIFPAAEALIPRLALRLGLGVAPSVQVGGAVATVGTVTRGYQAFHFASTLAMWEGWDLASHAIGSLSGERRVEATAWQEFKRHGLNVLFSVPGLGGIMGLYMLSQLIQMFMRVIVPDSLSEIE